MSCRDCRLAGLIEREAGYLELLFQQVLQQLRATWRRRWWVLPIAWLVCLAGWGYITTLPDSYSSSSRVFVNTDSVLDPLLRGMTVRPNSEQRVRMMTQTLLSDSNLEQIAREADLDVLMERDDVSGLVGMLRGINFNGSRRNNIYTISFSHSNPEIAYRVVRQTVDLFMEQGLGGTRNDITASSDFIQRQINRYADLLSEKEAELRNLRRNHPEIIGDGQELQTRIENERELLEDARLEREVLRERIQALQARLEKAGEGSEEQPSGYSNPDLEARISRLEQQLDDLQRSYTEAHPDVKQTRRVLEDLREQRQQEVAAYQASNSGKGGDGGGSSPLEMELLEAQSQVAALDTRIKRRAEQLAELEEKAKQVPQIESKYRSLQRNYEVLQESYRQLLSRREQAMLSGYVASETEAVDFRVLEPPRRPNSPASPNRPLLASGVLVAGLASGGGFAFLLAQLRGTVMSPGRLGELTGRPVLGQISRVRTPQHRQRRRLEMLVFFLALSALLAAYAGVLWYFTSG